MAEQLSPRTLRTQARQYPSTRESHSLVVQALEKLAAAPEDESGAAGRAEGGAW